MRFSEMFVLSGVETSASVHSAIFKGVMPLIAAPADLPVNNGALQCARELLVSY